MLTAVYSMADSGVSSGLVTAGSEAFGGLLDAVFNYIVPIILVVVGVYVCQLIGLSGVLADLIDSVAPSTVSASTVAIIADLGALAIWASIAGMFFYLDGKYSGVKLSSGAIVKWVMRALAGLFIGFALGELAALIQGKVNSGQLAAWVSQGKTALTPGR